MTASITLEAALRGHVFVTVEDADAQVYVGTLVAASFEHVKVVTGLQGKPKIIHVDDIVEILKVNASNPHVERVVPRNPGTMLGARFRAWCQVPSGRAGRGRVLRVRGPITAELTCRKCGETYIDEPGTEHFEMHDGAPCGGKPSGTYHTFSSRNHGIRK